MKVPPSGPIPSDWMAVGEAPGKEEVLEGAPFVGMSGQELSSMLHDAGILRSEVFLTNVVRERPPNNEIEHFIPRAKKDITSDCRLLVPEARPNWRYEAITNAGRMVKPQVFEGCNLLEREILAVRPKVILAFGNTALWALTGKWGIRNWRGSHLRHAPSGAQVVPTYNPAAVLRQWDWRFTVVQDLRRAKRLIVAPEPEPDWDFKVRPTFQEVVAWLQVWTFVTGGEDLELSVDIETRARQIACVGLASSSRRAICIPFMCVDRERSYWTREEEAEIWGLLRRLLHHPRVRVIGQNFSYDSQYLVRQPQIIPRLWWDTMVVHHLMFQLLPKGLDYLSSFYCPWHVYWKDEGKEWDSSMPEEQLWRYNCMDAVRTYEICQHQKALVESFGLQRQLEERRVQWWTILYPQVRGTRIDLSARARIGAELAERLKFFDGYFLDVLGHPLNPQSPKQMHLLFYTDFALPPIFSRKRNKEGARQITLDDEALEKIGQKYPVFRPLVAAIALQRTTRVIKSTFIDAPLDPDGRARTSYGLAATDTLRLNSQESVFGSGFNLQNIPSDKSKAIGKAIRRMSWLGEAFDFPNIREMFVPDHNCTFFDADLDRADLHVVVWEAEDEDLKKVLRMGVDMHLYAVRDIWGIDLPVEELIETHPNYPEHRGRHKHRREFAKVGVHAADYGAMPPTLAAALGVTIREADAFRKRWFGAHPGIPAWQQRVSHQLMTTRRISNKFGYSIYYFDRIETLLGEALAWVPQSTVALCTLFGWTNIATKLPEVEVLLQIHDANAGQFPTAQREVCIPAIKDCMQITVPYDDPLVIPVGVKTSEVSWGACK